MTTQEKFPVLSGAEAFHIQGNQVGVLVQHGFTGTTQSMRELGEFLGNCGYTVYGPRLMGHGTHYEDMENTTFQDWIASTEEGYRILQETCKTIFVVGLSMGGTLAVHLAHRFPSTAGLVLINAVILTSPEIQQAAALTEPRFLDAIGSDIKAEGVVELAYERTPMKSLGELFQLLEQTRPKVPEIQCPALIFSSVDDHVVPPVNATYLLENLGSPDKELVQLYNSYHVATLDHDKEEIKQRIKEFIQAYTKL